MGVNKRLGIIIFKATDFRNRKVKPNIIGDTSSNTSAVTIRPEILLNLLVLGMVVSPKRLACHVCPTYLAFTISPRIATTTATKVHISCVIIPLGI
jgi:hypothetical protein